MARLIDAEFEEKHYTSMLLAPTPDVTKLDQKNARIVIDALKMAPTVDAVPVCRCEDCKFGTNDPTGIVICRMASYPNYAARDPNWYCADGKRKGG